VLRGDNETLKVGKAANIQDSSIVHSDEAVPLVIGERVTVGHHVMLHGCTVGDGSLIGIQAVVLNGREGSASNACRRGSLVTENRNFPTAR
jgi:carbonic anhydrase/acetyltransferase-like protein (isoleucine patch superfamily)